MTGRFSAVLTTINAPYRRQINEDELAQCLMADNFPDEFIGQLWGFFGEISVEDQLAFAKCYGISAREIQGKAKQFSIKSGAHFPILDMVV